MLRISRVFGLVAALAVALAPGAILAKPHKPAAAAGAKGNAKGGGSSHKGARKQARSIGSPNRGKLEGAVLLHGGKHLKQRTGARSWGTPQLVGLLKRASAKVARKHRGAMMLVGDLSAREGGHLDRHNSHQSGRDADVAFYASNSKGKPLTLKRFVAFDGDAKAKDHPSARFDDAMNWALVEALLKDDKVSVRFLFVSNPLRARLLAYAAKKNVSKDLITRAASVMMSPPDADLHDDHVHVRIACPETMKDTCVEDAG